MRGATLVLFVCFVIYATAVIQAPPKEFRKQLQGPPSEFSSMAFPKPEAAALRADSSLVSFTLTPSRNGQTWSWSASYPVDTPDMITISVLSPSINNLQFFVKSPSSTSFTQVTDDMFDGPNSIGKKSSGPFGIDGNTVPSYSYTFFNPEIGVWSISIQSNVQPENYDSAPGLPTGYLVIDNASPMKLLSHLNTYELEQGREVGVVVRMIDENTEDPTSTELPDALLDVIQTATMAVVLPNGNEVTVPMQDDGLHYDGAANDGIYGATIDANTAGSYIFQPIITGVSPEGHEFQRSTNHLVQVSAPYVTLTGLAALDYNKVPDTLSFSLDVDTNNPVDTTVHAYAEVWGSDSSQLHYIPVAWVQSMTDIMTDASGNQYIELDLNENWVKLAGAVPPFQLRNVVIQDRDSNVLLSGRSEIYVKTQSNAVRVLQRKLSLLYKTMPLESLQSSIPITETMKYGPRPKSLPLYTNTTSDASNGKLLLVHGYCSSDVWPTTDFTNYAKFEDYTKSRSHDEFALLIKKFGDQFGVPYSIVGHSQGGLASLHLKTYYWSGLDTAANGRLIQSVGSPYRGCSLAGGLADVGSVFGVGCSSNFDLSTDGASLWLSKIPKEPQSAVYYYTTKYPESWWLFTSCVTASGLVMFTPNDGTCEIKLSTLDYGNNMGTKDSWCHTSGMRYPQQTTDVDRNKEMNSKAAR